MKDSSARILRGFSLVALFWITECLALTKTTTPCALALQASKFVGVVDGYQTGSHLADAIRARGFVPISLLSSPKLLKCYRSSYRRSCYQREFRNHGDVDRLLDQMANTPLHASIAGSEPGVMLNDEVAERLNLPGNGVSKSAARRHKSETQKILRAKGLGAIREVLTGSLSEALDFIENPEDGLGGIYPVVVKPNSSAGTDGFTLCHSQAEVEAAFEMVGKPNKLGERIDALLVQEYLVAEDYDGIEGGEYVINTVSLDGQHVVVEGLLYHKIPVTKPGGGQSLNYDYDELIDVSDPKYKTLLDYAIAVIEALDIQIGPTHLEIMMTKRGPVLIEMGARLMGGAIHEVTREAIGYSALELTLDAYLEPEKFRAAAARGRTPFPRKKHVALVQLIAPQSGYLVASPPVAEIEKLRKRSLFEYRSKKKRLHWIDRTIDLATSPGMVILMSDDAEMVAQDRTTVRRLEAEGLFGVESNLWRAFWRKWWNTGTTAAAK